MSVSILPLKSARSLYQCEFTLISGLWSCADSSVDAQHQPRQGACGPEFLSPGSSEPPPVSWESRVRALRR